MVASCCDLYDLLPNVPHMDRRSSGHQVADPELAVRVGPESQHLAWNVQGTWIFGQGWRFCPGDTQVQGWQVPIVAEQYQNLVEEKIWYFTIETPKEKKVNYI